MLDMAFLHDNIFVISLFIIVLFNVVMVVECGIHLSFGLLTPVEVGGTFAFVLTFAI